MFYILPMAIIGGICLWINYKFMVSEKIFGLLKIRKWHYKMLFYLFAAIALGLLAGFICDDILHASENSAKIMRGSFIGIAFLFMPAFHASAS